MTKYQLTLSEEQLRVISRATEFYMRIGLGQFEEIIPVYGVQRVLDPDAAHAAAVTFKNQATGMVPGESLGVYAEDLPLRFKIAYDLYQVTRHFLAWQKNPEGDLTVDYDTPVPSSNLPLPTVGTL